MADTGRRSSMQGLKDKLKKFVKGGEPQPKEPKPLDRPNPDHSRDDKQSQDTATDVAGRKDHGLAGADKLVSSTPGDKTTEDKSPSVGEALAGKNY